MTKIFLLNTKIKPMPLSPTGYVAPALGEPLGQVGDMVNLTEFNIVGTIFDVDTHPIQDVPVEFSTLWKLPPSIFKLSIFLVNKQIPEPEELISFYMIET